MTQNCKTCGKFVTTGGTCTNAHCKTKPNATIKEDNKLLTNKRRSDFHGKFELPNFLAENVELWWLQVETHLKLIRIADKKMKFKCITAALSTELVERMADLLIAIPNKNAFTILKDRNVK